MRVCSFIASLPPKQTRSYTGNHKLDTLRKFVQGVIAAGDQAQCVEQRTYQDCDVAVILGWVHDNGKQAPHLAFRREIVERQTQQRRRTVIVDSNLFLYKNTLNPGYYLRYSFDGIFPDTGEYCDQYHSDWRWQDIKRDLGIDIKDWRTNGNHILICLQRQGGWSMGAMPVTEWSMQVIRQLRQHSSRPVILRPHPGDRESARCLNEILVRCRSENLGQVSISENSSDICRDLKNCWAVINHNSSPAVAAAIEGIPVFVTDPVRSQARDVANVNISDIENPMLPDRHAWICRISQFHWSHQDLETGRCWNHMRQWAYRAD